MSLCLVSYSMSQCSVPILVLSNIFVQFGYMHKVSLGGGFMFGWLWHPCSNTLKLRALSFFRIPTSSSEAIWVVHESFWWVKRLLPNMGYMPWFWGISLLFQQQPGSVDPLLVPRSSNEVEFYFKPFQHSHHGTNARQDPQHFGHKWCHRQLPSHVRHTNDIRVQHFAE